jgi:hypothetical protein
MMRITLGVRTAADKPVDSRITLAIAVKQPIALADYPDAREKRHRTRSDWDQTT